ncbi:AAA family ATPase [Sporosarcina sp. SG10008]|uniref:AAA family ATPase n=1 Tax=Sporosarcina sp. SG10008 TaxID=3373103 RepID=UPI0037DCB755
MIIDYVWIKTEVSTYSIHLNRKFNYTVNLMKKKLGVEKNIEYIPNLYGLNIENIVAVIGENGAGKSTFLKVLMEVLKGGWATSHMYIIVGNDEGEYFFSTNIDNLSVDGINGRIPIERIKDFELIFYSNIFDANNLIKYVSGVHNISTNAMLDSFNTQSSGIMNYRYQNIQSQIIFTIINQKKLELSDFVKIPEFVYLKLNESVTESIYNKRSKEDRNYQKILGNRIEKYIEYLFDNGSKIVEHKHEREEKKEFLFKIFNFTYNKVIQWIEKLLDAIENETFLRGEIQWDKIKFDLFWNQLQSDLEVERSIDSIKSPGNIDSITTAQFDLIKNNISNISQNEINKEYETVDELINTIIINIEEYIQGSYLNIHVTEMGLIKKKSKEFLSENLDIDFLLNDDEIDELKDILEDISFNVDTIKKELHEWLGNTANVDSFEFFLENLEQKLILLLEANSVLKEIYVFQDSESPYFYEGHDSYESISEEFDLRYGEMDSERVARVLINKFNEDFYLFDSYDSHGEIDLLNNIESDLTFNNDIDNSIALNNVSFLETKLEYINKIMDMFKSYYTPMIEHLHIVDRLIDNISVKAGLIRIMTNDELLKIYIEKYSEDKFFNLEWRDLSSGEYSILNFFTRFYELKLSLNSNADILVVIDEGELYFHPQWQKRYIDILCNMFNHLLPNNRLQILITSHSPFVVSDLPHYNLVLLKKGNTDSLNSTQGLELERTFGGNIQDLFSNAFFIQGGLTGEYSKKVINNAINEILDNPENAYMKKDDYKRLFMLIGEPLVRNRCMEILNEAIQSYKNIPKDREEEIKELKDRLKYLEGI